MATEKQPTINSVSGKKDDKDVRVEVRKIENGYIIRKTIEWKNKKEGWQYETKEWYSKEDPFEITDKSLADLIE